MGIKSFLTRNIGKGIAKTQLRIFQGYRHNYPDTSNKEIFRSMLNSRLGWNQDDICDLCEDKNRNGSLLQFIYGVISYEYSHKLPPQDLAPAQLGAEDYLRKKKMLFYSKKEGVNK